MLCIQCNSTVSLNAQFCRSCGFNLRASLDEPIPSQLEAPVPAQAPAQVAAPEPALAPAQVAAPVPAQVPAQVAAPEPALAPAQAAAPEPALPPAQVAAPEPALPPGVLNYVCDQCGNKLISDSLFCGNCGVKVEFNNAEYLSLDNAIDSLGSTKIHDSKPLENDKSITFFGVFDGGALKKKAREKRFYLNSFNTDYKLTSQQEKSLNLLVELSGGINAEIDSGNLKGEFWDSRPLNFDFIEVSLRNKYLNSSIIDLKLIDDINKWLHSTLESIQEIDLIRRYLTPGVKAFIENIKKIDEIDKNFVNDEVISKVDRSRRLWEVVSTVLVQSFDEYVKINNIKLLAKVLNESSLGETVEKYTKEAFNSSPQFTYSVFNDNIYFNEYSPVDNMVLIDDEHLNELMNYLDFYRKIVQIFIDGNNLRRSHCNENLENSLEVDQDKLLSIHAVLFLFCIISVFADGKEIFLGIVVWCCVFGASLFYFINKLDRYTCTVCDEYKSIVLAKKDFQRSYSVQYSGNERDRITNSKGELSGHVERNVVKSKKIFKYDAATYCLACNNIHLFDIEEE